MKLIQKYQNPSGPINWRKLYPGIKYNIDLNSIKNDPLFSTNELGEVIYPSFEKWANGNKWNDIAPLYMSQGYDKPMTYGELYDNMASTYGLYNTALRIANRKNHPERYRQDSWFLNQARRDLNLPSLGEYGEYVNGIGRSVRDIIPYGFNRGVEYLIGKPINFILNSFANSPVSSNGAGMYSYSPGMLYLSDSGASNQAVEKVSNKVLSWTTPSGILGNMFPDYIEKIRGTEWGDAVLNAIDLWAASKMYKGSTYKGAARSVANGIDYVGGKMGNKAAATRYVGRTMLHDPLKGPVPKITITPKVSSEHTLPEDILNRVLESIEKDNPKLRELVEKKGINYEALMKFIILNWIDRDVIPRMLAMGHNVKPGNYVPTFRILDMENDAFDIHQNKVNSNAGAWFTPTTNDITLRGPLIELNFPLVMHEAAGHGLRHNSMSEYVPALRKYINEYVEKGGKGLAKETADALLKVKTEGTRFTEEEINILEESYPWIRKYFEENPVKSTTRALDEMGGVNTLFRASLSLKGRLFGESLNEIINSTPNYVILDKLRSLPYTSKAFIDELEKITGIDGDEIETMNAKELEGLAEKYERVQLIIDNVKNSMIKVGAYSVPITIGNMLMQNNKTDNK